MSCLAQFEYYIRYQVLPLMRSTLPEQTNVSAPSHIISRILESLQLIRKILGCVGSALQSIPQHKNRVFSAGFPVFNRLKNYLGTTAQIRVLFILVDGWTVFSKSIKYVVRL